MLRNPASNVRPAVTSCLQCGDFRTGVISLVASGAGFRLCRWEASTGADNRLCPADAVAELGALGCCPESTILGANISPERRNQTAPNEA